MNLEYLKTFRDVARQGSFSAVARRLGISQPAVSFQIQKLERELGLSLLDRSQKTVAVTGAGRRLLAFAEAVEVQRAKLQRELEGMKEVVSGELKIAASTIPGEFLLPAMLAEFKARYPTVAAEVVVSDSLSVIDSVLRGEYDIGFCGLEPGKKALTAFPVARDEIVLIVPPGHPFAGRGEVSRQELSGEPFIIRERTSGTQHNLAEKLSGALDQELIRPHLVLGSTQAVLAAVEAGAGIAFISSLAIAKSLKLSLVKRVPVANLDMKREFYGIYRSAMSPSHLLGVFISFAEGFYAGK